MVKDRFKLTYVSLAFWLSQESIGFSPPVNIEKPLSHNIYHANSNSGEKSLKSLYLASNNRNIETRISELSVDDIDGDACYEAQSKYLESLRVQHSMDRYIWLRKATSNLLDTSIYPLGSLVKGKWHELNSMLVAWAKWMEECSYQNRTQEWNQIPLLMESILKRIIDERVAGNSDVTVTTNMYNLVLDSWLISIAPNRNLNIDGSKSIIAAQRALDIVKHMQTQSESEEDISTKPNLYSMITVLKLWTRASALTSVPPSTPKEILASHVASRRAHQTLQYMEYMDRSGRNKDMKPNVLAYSLVMDSFAKSGEKDAGSKAEALLRRAQQLGVQPNLFCYNMVIHAYCRQGRRGGAVDHVERILHEIEEQYEKTNDESLRPDVVTYTSVISAWANSNRRGYAAKRAEDILNRMGVSSPPNTITYNAVLKAWCRSGEKNAADRALAIFKRMEQEYLTGNVVVQPDLITYNTLIHVLSKSGKSAHMNHAEILLAQIKAEGLKPNVFTFNTIIEGWSKVKDSDGSYKAYNALQKLLEAEISDKTLYADTFSFNHVIFAFSKSGLKSSALRAEELLRFMEKKYRNGNEKLKPDVFGYSAVIHAWANSGDEEAGERAEALLVEMESRHASGETNLKPNTVTYNSVIDSWAKSGKGVVSARKAEKLLERMVAMYDAGDISVKPTAQSYNCVLAAWARSRTKCAHRKSQELLEFMWNQYESGNKDLAPTSHAYNSVIDAVSKSQRQDKAQKALRILRVMDKNYRAGLNKDARPNEFTYASVLNSCAFSIFGHNVRKKALDTAIFTFEELRGSPYASPNHVTYGMFLKACANLIPADDERRRLVVEPVFHQCCQDGQVGEIVLKQLRLAAPEDLYQKLLQGIARPGSHVELDDIPWSWRCNVRDDRGRDRRRSGVKKNLSNISTNGIVASKNTTPKP